MPIYENEKSLSFILNKGLTPNPYKPGFKMLGIIFLVILIIVIIILDSKKVIHLKFLDKYRSKKAE